MATFTAANAATWKSLLADVAQKAPGVGKRVRIVRGRTHTGQTGQVFWHGPDRYYEARQRRYRNAAGQAIHEAHGTTGFRVGVRLDESLEKVFVSAEHVDII